MPNDFATSPDGLLYVASGMDPVLRWDGHTAQMETAGVAPPDEAAAVAFSGTGEITGTYYAYVRFVDRLGNVSNLSPISDEAEAEDNETVTYSSVPLPNDPKVTRRQILRNTAGQTITFYTDVDTDDLTSTTFTSTKTDSLLSAQVAVPLLDPDGNDLANRYTVPPDHKGVIAHHLERMFLAVEVVYSEGCVAVTFGSTTVTGIGTLWTDSVEGRYLHVVGGDRPYEIEAVDGQTLTLAEAYEGPTDPYAAFGIRPAPAERRLVYFSEAGLPEAWPAINALSLQEDGDEITGLMAKGSFLFILERRHVYRLTFQNNPSEDGFVFLSGNRGCVNNRCWCLVDDVAYMLDERGVHAFAGGGDDEHLTSAIQGTFSGDDPLFRINWSASRFFHCVHYPGQDTIRWFVALSGHYLPRHALCYDYAQKHWWIEELLRPVGASTVGTLDGVRKPLLGTTHKKVLGYWVGTLDGADPNDGTVRGTAESSTSAGLTDDDAGFAASLANVPVVIVSGKGKGQARLIASNTATALSLTQPWTTKPDETSVYQVGGIPWLYRSGMYRWVEDETEQQRRVEVMFQPTASEATMDLRIYNDLATLPEDWWTEHVSDDYSGVESTRDEPDLVIDLTKTNGFVQQRLPDAKEINIDGDRFVSVELRGVGSSDRQAVYSIQIDGAKQ